MGDLPVVEAYDLVILDLDGVVYLIDRPIPNAVETVTALHERRISVAYATNNASRLASEVADLLTGMGIPAAPGEVLTSARAAAAVLAEHHPPGSPVLVIGTDALRAEVRDAGLQPVDSADPTPAAVVQGYGPSVGWPELAEAAVAVRHGAHWVATNTDATLPSRRGPLPGNGALVAAVSTALGRQPDLTVGKPAPALFTTAAKREAAGRPLVVGDRLDTDIAGAVRAGMDSLLVMTGVTSPLLLLAAAPDLRPTYVANDLSGLFTVDAGVRVSAGDCEAGGWRGYRLDGLLHLAGEGAPIDALRALCGAAWASAAEGVPGKAVPEKGVTPDGPQAAAALRVLGL